MKLLAMILFIAGCGLFITGVLVAERERWQDEQRNLIADWHRLFTENSRQVNDLFRD